ncbi:hypothetical protein [Thermostaphylospora chromogena]|uniref:hypothetical protein n=1 Tax=Thermostaphylospora chromogena TaxID=35622 RepID=UPI000D08D1E3|nr:hypothetical protein [Thermostaphylospora chromogena]
MTTRKNAGATTSPRRRCDGRASGRRDHLVKLAAETFATLEAHRAAVTVMRNDRGYPRSLPGGRFDHLDKAGTEIERMWIEQIERGQRAGCFRSDVNPAPTYRLIRDGIPGTVRWFRPGGRIDTADLTEHHITVLFDGPTTGTRTTRRA